MHGLKYNLLCISQPYDQGFRVLFESSYCIIFSYIGNRIKCIGLRHKIVYIVDLDHLSMENMQCLFAMNA